MKSPQSHIPWRPSAVLFDFDGTLADSYEAIAASVNHVRALHALPPLTESEVRRHVGRGPEHLLTHTVPGISVAETLPEYRDHHPAVMRRLTRLLPGASEAIYELRRAGIRLGVCSNKPAFFTRQLLDFLGLAREIEVVVGPEEVPRPKPAPDMLSLALARLQIAAEAALYVGDMSVDIECARAAGMRVWVVSTGSEARADLERAEPDAILAELTELLPRLQLS